MADTAPNDPNQPGSYDLCHAIDRQLHSPSSASQTSSSGLIDIFLRMEVLVNRRAAGGEAACKPMLAAVANAIYDATAVRLRRIPLRAPRVLAALKASQV